MNQVLQILLAIIPSWGLLIVVDRLWEAKKIQVETSRKIIHMATGVYIAFWPLFISWTYIQVLSIALLGVILLSYKLHVFQSIHAVERITSGEILFPVAIAICAFIEPAPWMFTAAILHLAIADSLAAYVGTRWGKRTHYKIMSHGKSLVGSLAFLVTSLTIMSATTFFVQPQNLPSAFWLLVFSPVVLTLLENISWYGTDNITVPIAVIVLLSGLPS